MRVGTWIHDDDGMPLDDQISLAATSGIQSLRTYHVGYAQKIAPALQQAGMSLFADLWLDGEWLAWDWRAQVRPDELQHYYELGVPLEAICVGNEQRQGGTLPGQFGFTARVAFGLANLIATYREWLQQHGYSTPLTYAMEGSVFDTEGNFHEWVWPLIDACDVVSLNTYPMDSGGWYGLDAFEASKRFLHDARTHNDRFVHFEQRLRHALQQLEAYNKPVILSETGFPSAVGYRQEGAGRIEPESDNERYGERMYELVEIIRRVNADYGGRIQALYFYEWRDNLYHHKISNEEQSPIHSAFGLCDRFGIPKLDVKGLVTIARLAAG